MEGRGRLNLGLVPKTMVRQRCQGLFLGGFLFLAQGFILYSVFSFFSYIFYLFFFPSYFSLPIYYWMAHPYAIGWLTTHPFLDKNNLYSLFSFSLHSGSLFFVFFHFFSVSFFLFLFYYFLAQTHTSLSSKLFYSLSFKIQQVVSNPYVLKFQILFVPFHTLSCIMIIFTKPKRPINLILMSSHDRIFKSVRSFTCRIHNLHVEIIKPMQASNEKYKLQVDSYKYHYKVNIRDYFMILIRPKQCPSKTNKKLQVSSVRPFKVL